MFRRNRLSTTAALVCHLLLTSSLVTGQLLPPPAPSAARTSEPVTFKANQQERTGEVYKLRGNAEIDFRNLVLRADELSYDASSGEATATGHVTLDGGPHDEHIVASHAEYNVKTQTGKFYDVIGTSGVRFHGVNVVLTSSNPFTFTGKLVEKTGPETYVVHHGTVTSCQLPHPKWTLNAERIMVDLGGKAKAYNSTFRVEKAPLFYLPYADHPADQLGRQTGFLMPEFGTSSLKGTILGEAFYWAINRSMDTTVGAEYLSRRGWAEHGDWRFRPSEDSYLSAHYFGVLDRGFTTATGTRVDESGEDVGFDAQSKLPYSTRGVLSAEYLSSYLFRLAWGQTFAQAVNSEVKSVGFLSKSFDGFGFNFLGGRYQNFQSTTQGDVVTIIHTPGFEISSVDRKIDRTPVYWSFDTAAQGLSRSEPNCLGNGSPLTCAQGAGGAPILKPFDTDVAGRIDVNPRISLPLLLAGWTFRPEFALRETYYSERQLQAPPSSQFLPIIPVEQSINRNAAEASIEIRPPSLVRIFERPVLGHKLKHAVEPRLVYRYVRGIDNFPDIIRFDYRDILSDTNELEYGIVQRLYAKRLNPECSQKSPLVSPATENLGHPDAADPCQTPSARELVSWEVKQKYFFDPAFGGALINGVRNVLTTTAEFTGIAFLTSPRRFSPVVSRILVHPDNQTELGWQLDYDTVFERVNASTVFANYRLGSFFLGGTHTYFLTPGEIFTSPLSSQIPSPSRFNQFRITLGYGNLSKRGINAATNIGFDSNLNFLQYAGFQTTYNWDCCGLSFEYRRYSLGSIRKENQFRFAFSLANIATFGNLKRQERIY